MPKPRASGSSRAAQLSLARALTQRWQRRAAIEIELHGTAHLGTLPEGLLRGSSASRRASRAADADCGNGNAGGAHCAQMDEVQINEILCRHSPRLEALGEQQRWIESLEAQVAQLETEVLELGTHREEGHRQLGVKPGVAGGGLTKRGFNDLQTVAKNWQAARRQIRALREQAAAASELAADGHRQTAGALGAAKEKGLTQSLAEAGELVSRLRSACSSTSGSSK